MRSSAYRTLPTAFGSLVAACLLVSAAGVQADSQTTWFGEVAAGEWLAGIKLGAVDPDIPGYDETPMATLVLGYQFARPVGDRGSSSIELELGFSGSEDLGVDSPYGDGEYDVQAAGIFFNYRSPGTVYFKGKLGLLDMNIDTILLSGEEFKNNDANLAFGLGAGVRLGGDDGRATLEAEWVSTSGDIDTNLYNLGANIEF